MKKITLIVVLFLFACYTGYSQTKQESIKELIQLSQQDSTMERSMNAVMTGMSAAFKDQKDPAAIARTQEMMKASMEAATDMMKKFRDEDMVQIYDKHFSHQEINDYIAFYKSPSGKKMISSMPAVQKDILSLMSQKYLPQLMEEMKKQREATKKQ
jgi:uncharacterized protein